MNFLQLLGELEERGRIEEARGHLLAVASGLAMRGIGLAQTLAMEVDEVIERLEQPLERPGWDETVYGDGFVVEGHG